MKILSLFSVMLFQSCMMLFYQNVFFHTTKCHGDHSCQAPNSHIMSHALYFESYKSFV